MDRTQNTETDRWEIGTLVSEATGRADRRDPRRHRTGGPAGNARLTAWTGMVLLALLAVEGITLVDVRGLITWHIVVGSLLVPPALLKTASTGWRMVRYYAGSRDYRTAGPPPLLLRLLAPLVVASTLALLTTGIVVGVVGPDSARAPFWGTPASLLFLHQASFAVWVGATSLHVLGRLVPAARIIGGRAASAVDGRALRGLAVLVVLALAVWVATVVLAGSAGWVG
ncbi:MAG: hypothetical protein ABIO48_16125 [Pedococcus sp.]